jgi:Sulfotransferase family
MKLIESGIPDVIVSSRILHAATLFNPDHKGRLFTIMRNPIERAVSTFYYLQNAYWERHYRPELKEMTIMDYASLPDTANNWMTRWLTGKNAEPHLTRQDLAFAKELLRRKFLILLTDEMASSIERLLYYMNWEMDESYFEESRACLLANTKKEQGQNRNKHLTPDEGSPEYEALLAINDLDMELYMYATELFKVRVQCLFSYERS